MNNQFGRGALWCLLALVLAGCPTESDSGGGPAGDTDPPAAVSGLTGTAGNGWVNIEWIDPYDLDLDHIGITWTPGGDTPQTVTSGVQAAAVEGLTNGTEYTFTVQAVDRAGNGSAARTLSLSPDANIQHPDEVTKLEGAAGKGELTVTWADPAVDLDHVEVTWAPGDGSQTVEAGSQSARITGLTNDTAYTVTIKTVNGSGVKSPGRTITLVPSFVGLWTAVTGSPFGTIAVNKIAWGGTTGNEKFVAVGASGTLAYSSDGEIWASTASTFATTAINNIAWGGTTGNEKFVAVGASGRMAYSADGTSWTAITPGTSSTPGDTTFGTSAINGIAWGGTSGNEKFVAVGASGKMAYSADGTSWTAINPGTSSAPGDTTFGNTGITNIAWGNGTFVAVGYSGKIAYSSNGVSWTAIAPGTATDPGDTTFGNSSVNSITWGGPAGNKKFVAISSTGKMAWSGNGVTWTAVDSGLALDYNLNSIAWGGNRFVAVGTLSTNTYGKIFWSPDGLSWYPGGDSTFGVYVANGIAWGGGKFVVVGTRGNIAWAAP
jgi:hypothetical protein